MMDFLYALKNSWKKGYSFFLVFCALFAFEIPYIVSVEGTDNAAWYQCINYFHVVLCAMPALLGLGYILVRRAYMPKAPKDTKGIIFYIVNADDKQYKAIHQKFIKPLKKMISDEMPEYSVVVIDDYHSQKYSPILCEKILDNGEKQAKILKKRRGCIAVSIDCVNGGDGEELFCHMKTTLGVTLQPLSPDVRSYLIKDIATAFLPLHDVDIMKLTETPDLSRYSTSLDITLKYVFASICFHCGNCKDAIKLLEMIDTNLLRRDCPEMIIPIANVLGDRLAVCYRVHAENEYLAYCANHDEKHLIEVRRAINNKYCKKGYEHDNKTLEGICCFVLDKNINHAIQCMNTYSGAEFVRKYNKAFLYLYGNCTVTNLYRVYNLYKTFGSLPESFQEQVESFTFHEYEKDKTRKQLLWILFFVYDYQGNTILAKRCLDQFCAAFPWVAESKVSTVITELNSQYLDVTYDEGETYSI